MLKVLANQRSGYQEVQGEVTYGGTPASVMQKRFRGDIIYNPEDDLHYATLKVKDTLGFAIQSRTPGKESRQEGESRKEYQKKFLEIVGRCLPHYLRHQCSELTSVSQAVLDRAHSGHQSGKRVRQG